MPEFNRVEHASASPTQCAFCHTHEGPFIDTYLENMTIATANGVMDFQGRIYVCTREQVLGGQTGCVEQMAQRAGTMVENTRMDVLQIEKEQLQQKVLELEAELATEIANKSVPLAEVVEEMKKVMAKQRGRPEQVA